MFFKNIILSAGVRQKMAVMFRRSKTVERASGFHWSKR